MLKVSNLSIGFETQEVVHEISFEVEKGEIVGIIGESGSGKSVTALAIADLLADTAWCKGSILYEDTELTKLSAKERREYKGKEISMIFQEPMTSLNPVLHIGSQIEEPLIIHTDMDALKRRELVLQTMEAVGLENPEGLLDKYPHELSGGMRQRAMIAIALICNPSLMIADEPTTALDVKLQGQILELLKDVARKRNMAMIFISHNMSIVQNFCDRVYVMHLGRLVESGTPKQIFEAPQEDYTKRLISSIPDGRLREDICDTDSPVVLEVKDFSVFYPIKRKYPWEKSGRRQVVKQVSFSVREGEMIGLVGQSGCGKSTLSKGILGLQKDTEGEVFYDVDGKYTDMQKNKKQVSGSLQMIFQDPYSSLNPAKKVGWILEEPLRQQERKGNARLSGQEKRKRVLEILSQVGLEAEMADRYPSQLSGGQRQRVSIALSLIQGARFIIADEPVSALDVTVQKQILELLKEIQMRTGIACLFISHDKAVVNQMCHRIFYMEDGRLTESRPEE